MSNDGAPRSLGGVRETSLKQAARQLGDAIDADADCLVTLRFCCAEPTDIQRASVAGSEPVA